MNFICRFWPSCLTFAVIMYATLSNDPLGADQLPPIPYADKLIHAIMMGGMYGAIIFDIMRGHEAKVPPMRVRLLLALAMIAFGFADEVFQALMPNARTAEFADFIADAAGVVVAFFTAPPAVKFVLGFKKR